MKRLLLELQQFERRFVELELRLVQQRLLVVEVLLALVRMERARLILARLQLVWLVPHLHCRKQWLLVTLFKGINENNSKKFKLYSLFSPKI